MSACMSQGGGIVHGGLSLGRQYAGVCRSRLSNDISPSCSCLLCPVRGMKMASAPACRMGRWERLRHLLHGIHLSLPPFFFGISVMGETGLRMMFLAWMGVHSHDPAPSVLLHQGSAPLSPLDLLDPRSKNTLSHPEHFSNKCCGSRNGNT